MTDTRSRNELIDETKIQAVLAATKVRDDPHFLARVAIEISSPRTMADTRSRKERISKTKLEALLQRPKFGTMHAS